MPKLTKKQLTESQKKEVILMYPQHNIQKIAMHFRVGVEQIMEILDNAGIPRRKNKKREVVGFNQKIKNHTKCTTATVATKEYLEYLMSTLAIAGRMEGEASANMEKLLKQNPFHGEKRITKKI